MKTRRTAAPHIPPHNLDAERAVLGAVLLEGRETLPRVIGVLRPSDFYTEAHRAVYQAMTALFDRGPVDVLILTEELRRNDELDLVGGPAALARLLDEASVGAYLDTYMGIVRDHAIRREAIQLSHELRAYPGLPDDDPLGQNKVRGRARKRRRHPDPDVLGDLTRVVFHRRGMGRAGR